MPFIMTFIIYIHYIHSLCRISKQHVVNILMDILMLKVVVIPGDIRYGDEVK